MGGGDWKTRSLSSRYIDFLTSSPNRGKVAHQEELIKEVMLLTGTNPEARIPTNLRRSPKMFFAMWETLRSKAQKMIAMGTANVATEKAPMLLSSAANARVEETVKPSVSTASGSLASSSNGPDDVTNNNFMLASLVVGGNVVKTKRICVLICLSFLKTAAISTFDLPEDSDLAFEVLDHNAQDVWHHVSCCVS